MIVLRVEQEKKIVKLDKIKAEEVKAAAVVVVEEKKALEPIKVQNNVELDEDRLRREAEAQRLIEEEEARRRRLQRDADELRALEEEANRREKDLQELMRARKEKVALRLAMLESQTKLEEDGMERDLRLKRGILQKKLKLEEGPRPLGYFLGDVEDDSSESQRYDMMLEKFHPFYEGRPRSPVSPPPRAMPRDEVPTSVSVALKSPANEFTPDPLLAKISKVLARPSAITPTSTRWFREYSPERAQSLSNSRVMKSMASAAREFEKEQRDAQLPQ